MAAAIARALTQVNAARHLGCTWAVPDARSVPLTEKPLGSRVSDSPGWAGEAVRSPRSARRFACRPLGMDMFRFRPRAQPRRIPPPPAGLFRARLGRRRALRLESQPDQVG